MTQAGITQTDGADQEEQKVSARDWIVIPLLGLLTIGLIGAVMGLSAAWMFGKTAEGVGKCMQPTDPVLGVHGRPNAVCSDKGRETELIEYKLNNCGYRMDVECGPPQPGTYRIVMMGSSIAMGQWVQRERSLAALLPQELSLQTGRKIEVYNEGMMWEHPQVAALRFNEILAAKPNIVLWILMPADIIYVTDDPASMNQVPSPPKSGLASSGWRRLEAAVAKGITAATAGETWRKMPEKFLRSSIGVMLAHYLYQSETRYVDSYLRGPDSNADFLRVKPSDAWSKDLKQLDKIAEKIEGQARAAGIPLAVVLVPNRPEAAMISMGHWPADFDPYKLGKEVRLIVESHGGKYVDILSDFRTIPNAEKYYFPVDGHPNADGHAMISRFLCARLTGGPGAVLRSALQ